jgi:hypothetical protein
VAELQKQFQAVKIGLGKKNGTFAIPSLITGLTHFAAELIERKYS